ncbi:MAG: TetR/AcrR family transcriptional regulator [Sphaerobacteraceae bacterium]|nr:MAG: TetR/AcrR family transcriptional regulator [Sphaerobacteraceae bacterium]
MAPERSRPPTKAAQREATRQALILEARRQFAERGYAGVSLAEIVDGVGVTKGALYHLFPGKEALFREVVCQLHAEVAERIGSTATEADHWTQLVLGCEMFLRASTEPGIQQIMLIDAPAVLGWDAWRQLDASTSMQQLDEIIRALIDEGVVPEQPVPPLVHLLSGAMNEAALWLAHSDDRERDLADVMAALTRLLESLRT